LNIEDCKINYGKILIRDFKRFSMSESLGLGVPS